MVLESLKLTYPGISFEAGNTFLWSPKNSKVIYRESASDEVADWSLLHETGHALLEHHDFATDFDLLLMEVAAWDKAKKLASDMGLSIDEDHVQDCLDTYREWLYQRSTCPSCTSCSLQSDKRTYECFNCGTTWHVSASRMCRPYRLRAVTTTAS